MGDASSEVRSSASGLRPGVGEGAGGGDYEYDYTSHSASSLADSPSGAASGERLSSVRLALDSLEAQLRQMNAIELQQRLEQAAALSSIDESRSALVRLLQEGHDGTPGAVDSFLSETASTNRPNSYTSFRPEPISAAPQPVPEPAAVTAPVTPIKPQVRSAPRAKTSASTPTRARVEGRLLRDGDEQVNLASPTHTDENMMSDDEGRMVADVLPPPNNNLTPQPPTATPAATTNTRLHPPTSQPDTTTTTPLLPTSAPKPPATRPVGAQPKDNRSGSRMGLLIKLGVAVGAVAIVLKVAHTHQQRNNTNKGVPVKVTAASSSNKGAGKKVAVINPNPKQASSAQEKKLPASVVPVVPTTRSKFYSQAPSKGNNGQPDVLAGRG